MSTKKRKIEHQHHYNQYIIDPNFSSIHLQCSFQQPIYPSTSTETSSINHYNSQKLNEIMIKASHGEFKRIMLNNNNGFKSYSAIYNFFDFHTSFEQKPDKPTKISFKCIICGNVLNQKMGETGNLIKHLELHETFRNWKLLFDQHKNKNPVKPKIVENLDHDTLDMVKFYLSSDVASQALENVYLRSYLTRHGMYWPPEGSFINNVLPRVIYNLKSIIEYNLKNCEYINLIVYVWDPNQLTNLIGVCASILDSNFEKKLIVIGFRRMTVGISAESIKPIIENIVKEYNFDKNKIKSVVCDEGSTLVTHFKHILAIHEINQIDQNELDDDILLQLHQLTELKNYPIPANELPSIESVDAEINEDLNILKTNSAQNKAYETTSCELNQPIIKIEETIKDCNSNYNLTFGKLLTELELEIDSNKVVRFSCANHKFNMALRTTISTDKNLRTILALLSNNLKRNHQPLIFDLNKSTLRSENNTRWTCAFHILNSYHKAYEKGYFDKSNKCPVKRDEIEFYLSLLLPAFRFSLLHQRNRSHIGDLIPSIYLLIKQYEQTMKCDKRKLKFSENLISNIKNNFAFELNSDHYNVAAFLNVSKLSLWYEWSSCKNIIDKALDGLYLTYHNFFPTNDDSPKNLFSTTTSSNKSANSNNLDDEAFASFCDFRSQPEPKQQLNSLFMEQILNDEKKTFVKKLQNIDLHNLSNKTFWLNNKNELPHLFKLALLLLNIPVSSVYVERYFSICGIMDRNKSSNTPVNDTFITRSFLKSNIHLIEIS